MKSYCGDYSFDNIKKRKYYPLLDLPHFKEQKWGRRN
jgi:hypothetical protein